MDLSYKYLKYAFNYLERESLEITSNYNVNRVNRVKLPTRQRQEGTSG